MEAFDQLHKNLHKARYYFSQYLRLLLPDAYGQFQSKKMFRELENLDGSIQQAVWERVDYYNKLSASFVPDKSATAGSEFTSHKKSMAYFLDYSYFLSFFPKSYKASYLLGDITHVPAVPTFVKSRPVLDANENENSVLLKLNQIRHYYFVKDKVPFADKIPKLVWRGKTTQVERQKFLEEFFRNSWCDVGDTYKKTKDSPYQKPFMSIPEQLRYKYILSIEGYDVATNTKWIMASSSLCFMRKPRFETWFMEGRLIPGKHYVLLRDDYSDLEEKIEYYEANPGAAAEMIKNANAYVSQFFNRKQELLISLLVMQKYFALSGQAGD